VPLWGCRRPLGSRWPRSRRTTTWTPASATAACAGRWRSGCCEAPLARELGRAVFRFAQARLGSSDVDRGEHAAVLAWLRGEKVPAAALRPALIHSRDGRDDARPLLLSRTRLLLDAGRGGLVLCIDDARLVEPAPTAGAAPDPARAPGGLPERVRLASLAA